MGANNERPPEPGESSDASITPEPQEDDKQSVTVPYHYIGTLAGRDQIGHTD